MRERLSSVYTFLLTEDVTVSAVFASSSDDLPVVTFSSLAVSSFQALFRGHWKSEEGETLYIGEKKLRYHGAAVSSVTPRNSGAEQSYNFELDGTVYSIAWARTDYTVGYVIDILNIRSGEREFFFPDPLPTERVTLDGIYAGDWTCVEEGQTRTLSVENNTVVYNDHTITDIIDGGYYETTNDIFATPIGTNIYFFLQGGQMHILMWNGSLNCPDVDGYVFSGGSEQGDYTFPEALRGVWKSVDGKTAVITETSFTLNGESVSVRGSDAAFIFTAGGKTYEGNLYAGSDDILQISSEIYGNDGLLAGYTYEYYFREGRPAVTLNAVLEGTWTGINGTAGSVSVSGGQIVWNGVSLTVVAAGEERTDGYVYYVAVGGKVYELSVLNTAESDDMPPLWLMTLTGDGETYFFAASET